MSQLGGVGLSAIIGLGSVLLRPQRGFFPFDADGAELDPIVAQVTIEEIGHDELEITDHPIEFGSVISDHAFKRPAEVIIRCAWSNSGSIGVDTILGLATNDSTLTGNAIGQASNIYDKLLALQVSGIPFDVWTGKRQYTDMLFKSLTCTTDRLHENSLLISAHCRQLLIVNTQQITVPINTQAQGDPQSTTPTQDKGQQQLQDAPGYVGS